VKRALALLGLGLFLTGCAQSAAPSRSFNDPTALRYINEHGVLLDVQVPGKDFVSASMVIDAKTAMAAQQSSQNAANAAHGAGLVGLLVLGAVQSQVGSGALESDARNEAEKDARPMANLLAGQPLDNHLQQRFQRASAEAGIRQAQNRIAARLVIQPKIVLAPDRGSFSLFNEVEVQDIAGSALYHARIEVMSKPFRRCGELCIDSGELDLEKVTAVLDACIDESMTVLAQDLQNQGSTAPQQTIRYVINGQRHVERGQLLSGNDTYVRYRSLDGAVKSAPVQLEGALPARGLQQLAATPDVPSTQP
jgi:hypothetical protein